MPGFLEHVVGSARGGLDRVTEAIRGREQTVPSLRLTGDRSLRVSRVCRGSQQLEKRLLLVNRELVDRPHPNRWLANLANRPGGGRIRRSGLPNQSGSPRDELLERTSVEVSQIHGAQCASADARIPEQSPR